MLVRNDNTVLKTVSGSAVKPGHYLATDCGRIGIVVGAQSVAVGDKATLATKGRVRVLAGANLAVGDVASIKPSTQTALAADASDSINAGLVVLGANSGSYVEIDLNEFPYTTPAE